MGSSSFRSRPVRKAMEESPCWLESPPCGATVALLPTPNHALPVALHPRAAARKRDAGLVETERFTILRQQLANDESGKIKQIELSVFIFGTVQPSQNGSSFNCSPGDTPFLKSIKKPG